jgi:hypothetical protein
MTQSTFLKQTNVRVKHTDIFQFYCFMLLTNSILSLEAVWQGSLSKRQIFVWTIFFKDSLLHAFELKYLNFFCPQKIPQQMNGSDCGMFACTLAEYICSGADVSFTQQDMPYFRRKMAYEIYTCKLLMWSWHSGMLWLSFQCVCFGIL